MCDMIENLLLQFILKRGGFIIPINIKMIGVWSIQNGGVFTKNAAPTARFARWPPPADRPAAAWACWEKVKILPILKPSSRTEISYAGGDEIVNGPFKV